MSEKESKPVLLIGTFKNEKIVNEIHLSGRDVITKNLTSSPQNWDNIIVLLKNKSKFSCVFVSLSESVLLISQCKSYTEKLYTIIRLLEDIPHLVFIYQDNLFGKFNIFNTNYYAKYLFYDKFFANREIFNELNFEYFEYSNKLLASNVERYFFEIIIPASFFAEEDEWEKIKKQHGIWNACDHIVEHLYKQLSFYDNEEFCEQNGPWGYVCEPNNFDKEFHEPNDPLAYFFKPNNLERFVDRFRSEMALSPEERSYFLSLPTDKKYEFIESRFLAKKAQYEAKDYKERDPIGDEEIEAIHTLIQSDNFTNAICQPNNYETREWVHFKKYLRQKLYCEDEKIAEACAAMNEIITNLNNDKVRLWPYKFSNEIVIRIRDFFENENGDVVFRRYILKDILCANELDNFLSLFQEYITRVRGVDISFEQRRTDIGTIYIIKSSNKSIVKSEFPQYVADFAALLDYCDKDIEKARETLRVYCKSSIEIEQYIARYQIRARRLKTDMRQEYERRMLLLRHEIENAALEDAALEEQSIAYTFPELQKAILPQAASVVVNVVKDNTFSVSGNLDKLIFGDYIYNDYNDNETDKQLIEYIDQLSKDNIELITELRILKDGKASKDQKRSAWGKLKGFLSEHATDIGKIAFDLLSKYLESLL